MARYPSGSFLDAVDAVAVAMKALSLFPRWFAKQKWPGGKGEGVSDCKWGKPKPEIRRPNAELLVRGNAFREFPRGKIARNAGNWGFCNPEGIVSASPGLRGTSYPGFCAAWILTPTGLRQVVPQR